MKSIVVLALCILAGCAGRPTLEQLESEALLSGDWSAVERRERAQLRGAMRASMQCPASYVGVCIDEHFRESCSCIKTEKVNTILAGRY